MDIGAILEETGHRPWPLPRRPWALQMGWEDLAFLHWPVSPQLVQPLLPRGLTVDTFEGRAWIGVVPFRMAEVRLRGMPPIPTTAVFEELNVRTYVLANGRPGVWFFSLDAASRLAVRGARWGCGLPYFDAAMELRRAGERCEYRSRRVHRGAREAAFEGTYWPVGPAARADEGTLEHWLVERYCLVTVRRKRICQLDVHHRPWVLQSGAAEIRLNSMAEASGIPLPAVEPLVHFVPRLDVVAWAPAAL